MLFVALLEGVALPVNFGIRNRTADPGIHDHTADPRRDSKIRRKFGIRNCNPESHHAPHANSFVLRSCRNKHTHTHTHRIGFICSWLETCVCVYYCRTYDKAVRGGGGRRVEDMCYERRRAKACVDESAHHALGPLRNPVV